MRPEGGARTLEESLLLAKVHGAVPVADGFIVGHYEYDAERLAGYDYDIGQTCHREARVRSVEAAEVEIAHWGFDPTLLAPYHLTDAP